jgi:futalosine hydrolase
MLPKPCLFLTAAPAESEAIARAAAAASPGADWLPVPLAPGVDLARTGVGKVNAAIAAARLADPARYRAVLNLGIGGALPPSPAGSAPLEIGTVVIGRASIYADEGVQTPDGFLDLSDVGFPPAGVGNTIPGFDGARIISHLALRAACLAAIGPAAVECDIATVSTCSGTDDLARTVATRTGAAIEAMEGAAIAHALARLHGEKLPFCEIRIISNTTGDRSRQRWDIKGALAKLTATVALLLSANA